MTHQALFSVKDKVRKKTKVSSAAILLGSLKINVYGYESMF